MNKLISVIIPTYNRAHLIINAIDSVLDQTYTNFELLVVDDNSTDNTKEIIEQYNDGRIKYLLNNRTKGAQGARNTGLYAAKGEWVATLDSDDIWLPNKLELQMSYICDEDNNIVGLGCGFAVFDFKNKKIIKEILPIKESFTTSDLLYKNYIGGFSIFLFKKESGLKVNGFDEAFPAMQDMDFFVSLSEIGHVKSLNRVLVYMKTTNEDRISNNLNKKYSASKLFSKKYKYQINKNIKLKNRAISRIYMYGFIIGEIDLPKLLRWAFKGVFIDLKNQLIVSNYIIKGIIKKNL